MFKTAGSIMDNIAEGAERSGNKEFMHLLINIERVVLGELISQLYRALDAGLNQRIWSFNRMRGKRLDRYFKAQLMNFMKYLKQSERKGAKFEEPQAEYQLKESAFYDARRLINRKVSILQSSIVKSFNL